ncbi:hypothetical protein NMG60_11001177 [Bertholletia excelsa]
MIQLRLQATPNSLPIKVLSLSLPLLCNITQFLILFRNFFYIQFFLVILLVIGITVRSQISTSHNRHFHPLKYLLSLLASTACGGISGIAWYILTLISSSRTLRMAFWLSPLLTCGVGVLLISIGSTRDLAVAVIALLSAVILSLYACWVSPRFSHAIRVLLVSAASPSAKTTVLVILSIITSTLYSAFLVAGIGGATATRTGTLDALFILIILLSLSWTMHVIKNTLQVTISRVKYMNFAGMDNLDIIAAFHDTMDISFGSICMASAMLPILGLVRGSARAMSLVSGDADEFMFSCANCYSGFASRLVMYGNRWGLVHIGIYNKGFVQASTDTWKMFQRVGLEPLIDSDLTSSFCFLCGVAGGAVCALVGGSWALVVHNGYATEISIYAFLVGYFMCRVAMAWPQACVSAYLVAYAENPQGPHFGSMIPDRLQELQRAHAQQEETTNSTQVLPPEDPESLSE